MICVVALGLGQYSALTDNIEMKLDEADRAAEIDDVRYTEDEIFDKVKARTHGK